MANFIALLLSFTSLLSPIILFMAACYYLTKNTKPDAILLFIGSGISLLTATFFNLMPRYLQSSAISLTDSTRYYTIAGAISFLGGVCFAAGFFILIINTVNAYRTERNVNRV